MSHNAPGASAQRRRTLIPARSSVCSHGNRAPCMANAHRAKHRPPAVMPRQPPSVWLDALLPVRNCCALMQTESVRGVLATIVQGMCTGTAACCRAAQPSDQWCGRSLHDIEFQGDAGLLEKTGFTVSTPPEINALSGTAHIKYHVLPSHESTAASVFGSSCCWSPPFKRLGSPAEAHICCAQGVAELRLVTVGL